jgi:hypothetical protein
MRARLRRRALLAGATGCALGALGADARAFGEEGAFNPRVLITGKDTFKGRRRSAPARWSLELVRRTSAPARLSPTSVRADAVELLAEPFALWSRGSTPAPLTRSEVIGLRRFFALGGVLLVDDWANENSGFIAAAKKQLTRVIPQGSPIAIGKDNVIFRSFYLLDHAAGRVPKNEKLEAIVRGGAVQVVFCHNDLLGALARGAGGVHPFELDPERRERSVRLAVNIAMYVLCSNYKDDQVHAPFLLRRRASESK